MKNALLTLLLILIPVSSAVADTMLRFTDGNSLVWDNVFIDGDRHCTLMDIGTVCFRTRDIVSIKTVEHGTQASEYGLSVIASDENVAARKADLSITLTQMEASDREFKARREQRERQDAQTRRKLEKESRDRQRNRKSDFGE